MRPKASCIPMPCPLSAYLGLFPVMMKTVHEFTKLDYFWVRNEVLLWSLKWYIVIIIFFYVCVSVCVFGKRLGEMDFSKALVKIGLTGKM